MKSKVFILFVFTFSFFFSSNLMSQNKGAYFGNTTSSCLNYVEIGNVSISGNILTVEASFNLLPNNANCTSTPLHDIISKHYDNTDVNYLLRPDHAEINTTSGFYVTKTVPISADNCHHIAMVYDGTFLRFFLDSSFIDSVAVTGDLITNSLLTKIGYSAGLNPNWFTQFWGYIDEVRIWKVARTESQLREFAFSNLNNVKTHIGLIAYYDFQTGFENIQGNSAYNGHIFGDVQLSNFKSDCIKLVPEKPDGENILITPNPVTDKLYVKFGDSYTKVKRITLFNVLGQSVYQTVDIKELNVINMANFIAGVYFVNVSFDNRGDLTEKIVKFQLNNYFR